MERESKILKVRRLLALAQSASENEAAAAMDAAHRIMLEYDISEAEAESAGDVVAPPEPVASDVLWTGNGQVTRWESILTAAVTNDTGTMRSYVDWLHAVGQPRRRQMKVIGQPSAVDAARLMYAYLATQVRRLAEEAYELRGRPGLAWKYSFLDGCAHRIRERMREQRKATTADVRRLASGGALMVLDQRAAIVKADVARVAKVIGLVSRGRNDRGVDRDGYEAGKRAGDRADLSQPTRAPRIGGGS